MYELWLKFTDPDGSSKRIRVDGSRFVIGRHSDCDLSIADSRLSRKHAVIERFGDRYEIVDAGSSNGTDVNGTPVIDPVPISDGAAISLGGYRLAAEIVSRLAADTPPAHIPATAATPAASPAKASTHSATQAERRSIPIGLLLIGPLLAVVLVLVAGGVIYLVVAKGSGDIASNGGDLDDQPSADVTTKDKDADEPGNDAKSTTTSSDTGPGSSRGTSDPGNSSDVPPAKQSETAKIETNSAAFLRKIAQNDPKIFLTTEQAERVASKIKQLGGASAIAENIKAAQKNAAQIRTIAGSKNLKPQFLAVAAIAKLGTSRGDVVQTAQSMSEVLDKLSIQIGNELADDCLLMIAAYDQGAAGDTMKMRNMLQDLAGKSTESSRTIRTIWFLQKQNKISPGEFERAITFLAIGTIAQNPKDFDVNAEALNI
ncbi:MAG: FHA domain-containing protein [Pyrinomonadaceae bacterium]